LPLFNISSKWTVVYGDIVMNYHLPKTISNIWRS
jgi:hypothetical protein